MIPDTTWRAAALNELAHATADVAAAVEALRLARLHLVAAQRDLNAARKYEAKLRKAIDVEPDAGGAGRH